jgi:SprB repeat/Cytochrome C oxidase, cbb3-type, subunit III
MKKIYFIIAILTSLIFIEACKKTPVTPTPPTPVDPCLSKTISVTGTTTQTSNATTANGTITASATGSTGFSYSTNGTTFQATGNFTGLAVGNYTVTAKDADGCIGTKAFTITAASCPTITIVPTITAATGPAASNGAISLVASGGTAPYQYSKDNGINYQASGNFTNLSPVGFNIAVKDANNCTATLLNLMVTSVCPTITATATSTTTVKCASNTGTLMLGASGGASPYTYSINGGAFQSGTLFSTLPFGAVTYVVKDANGCTSNGSSSIAYGPAGTGFTAVKNIMNTYCTSCHGATSPQSGINFTDDCTIVSKAARIKARCVDLNPSQMPPSGPGVTAAEKAAITAWVTAGGNYNN